MPDDKDLIPEDEPPENNPRSTENKEKEVNNEDRTPDEKEVTDRKPASGAYEGGGGSELW